MAAQSKVMTTDSPANSAELSGDPSPSLEPEGQISEPLQAAPELIDLSPRAQRWWPWLMALGLAVALALMWWLSSIFAPLGVGLLLAYVLEPAVDRLEHVLGNRSRAAAVLIGGFFAGLALLTAIAIPMLVQEGRHWAAATMGEGNPQIAKDIDALIDYGTYAEPDLTEWQTSDLVAEARKKGAPQAVLQALGTVKDSDKDGELSLAQALGDQDADGRLDPGYARRWKKLSRDRNTWLGSTFMRLDRTGLLRDTEKQVRTLLDKDTLKKRLDLSTFSTAGNVSMRVLGSLGQVFGILTTAALVTVLVPVYAFFFLLALPRWRERLPLYLPAQSRDRWLHVLGRIGAAVSGFVRGRLVVCGLVGLVTAIGWAVLGVRLGMLMGLLVGLLTVVPLANVLAFGPVLLMGLLDVASDVHGWGWFAGVIAMYSLGQLVESVLNPIIVGDAVQLDMVSIVVAFLVGAAVAGMVGLLVAVPIAATGRILLEELVLPRWRAWAAARA